MRSKFNRAEKERAMWRKLTITVDDKINHVWANGFTYEYDAQTVKDSEALHLALGLTHPGEGYSVKFETIED